MGISEFQSNNNFYHLFALCLILCGNCINTELASSQRNGEIHQFENIAEEVRHIQERVGTRGGNPPLLERQATGNASLNQLADNLNRLEGNLASLIQSFLALQRSVFNLEQLQELLVLLLEDILKQSASMDPGGGGRDNKAANPTTSESKESRQYDDADMGVDSADIDEAGDDTGPDDTGRDDDEGNQGTNNGKTNDNKNGEGGAKGGQGNQGTEPFGAIREGMSPTTTLNQQTERENRVVQETKPQSTTDMPVFQSSGESDDRSSEMAASGSMESNRVLPRMNSVGSKPASAAGRRETAVAPRKSPAHEPLMTFAAQLEERLHDLVRRLSPLNHALDSHHGRMALMRQQGSSSISSAGESPMARPPPMFEPLEIVAANNAPSRKDQNDADDVTPVKVKLQRQLNRVVSHGGPLVGPEDFSSPFMENLGSKVLDSGESLNERSTGMINNILQHDQGNEADEAVPPSFHSHDPTPRPATPSQLDTLPSATDRRRRQTLAAQALLPTRAPTTDPSTPLAMENDKSVNSVNGSSFFTNNTDKPKVKFPSTANSDNSWSTPTTVPTTDDDFDILIANLLHDLSQQLQSLYDQDEHEISVAEEIDWVVLELDSLIWIPSTTPVSAVQSQTTSRMGHKQASKSSKTEIQFKHDQALNPNQMGSYPDDADNFIWSAAHMGNEVKDEGKPSSPIPPKESLQEVPVVKNTTDRIETTTAVIDKSSPGLQNESQPVSWDWLMQLPFSHQGKDSANLGKLVGILSHLSQLQGFSQELKAISARGQQIVDNNGVSTQGTDEQTTSNQDQLNSEEDSSQSEDSSVEARSGFELTTVADDVISQELQSDESADNDAILQVTRDNFSNLEERKINDNNENKDNKNMTVEHGKNSDSGETDEENSSYETDEQDVDYDTDASTDLFNDEDQDSTDSNIEKMNAEETNSNMQQPANRPQIVDRTVEAIRSDKIQNNNEDVMENDNTGRELDDNDVDNEIDLNDDQDDGDDDDKDERDDDEEEEEDDDDDDNNNVEEDGNESMTTKEMNEIKEADSAITREGSTNSDEDDRKGGGYHDSLDVGSSERESYTVTMGDQTFQHQDGFVLEPPRQYLDQTDLMYDGYQHHTLGNNHHILKRDTLNHKNSLIPLLSTKRNLNLKKHKIKKRQVPSFWQFLNGNNGMARNPPPSQTFGSFGNQAPNLDNLFSLPTMDGGQTRNRNMQHPLSPLGNTNLDMSQTLHQPQGQPFLNDLNTGQSPQHITGKNPSPHFNQQRQNLFGQPQQSPGFPFNPPIGGYPQYHGYQQRFHYPQFGFPGGSNYEPGESPAAEAAADMEEILNNLFQRYWENVRNLFAGKGAGTTQEAEYEGPITTPRATTITTTKATTAPTTTTATTVTTATRPTTTMKKSPPVTTQKTQTAAATSPSAITTTVVSFNATEGQNITHIAPITSSYLPETNVSQIEALNISSSVPDLAASITSPPVTKPVTVPNGQPERGSTLLFNLIKSLEMMTRRPTV